MTPRALTAAPAGPHTHASRVSAPPLNRCPAPSTAAAVTPAPTCDNDCQRATHQPLDTLSGTYAFQCTTHPRKPSRVRSRERAASALDSLADIHPCTRSRIFNNTRTPNRENPRWHARNMGHKPNGRTAHRRGRRLRAEVIGTSNTGVRKLHSAGKREHGGPRACSDHRHG